MEILELQLGNCKGDVSWKSWEETIQTDHTETQWRSSIFLNIAVDSGLEH